MPGNTFDFFGPYFSAKIIDRQSKSEMPFWFGPGSIKNAGDFAYRSEGPVPAENMMIASELTVEENLGGFYTISLGLQPTYEDAITLLNSNVIISAESMLWVEFGYYSSSGKFSSAPFMGVVIDPDFSIGADISLTLKAQASGGYGFVRASSAKQFPPTKRSALIEQFAVGFGDPKRDVQVVFDVDDGSIEKQKLDEEISFTPGGKNDLLSIRDLCDQCLCTFFMEAGVEGKKDTLRVLGNNRRFGAPPTQIFRLFPNRVKTETSMEFNAGQLYGVTAGTGGILPILSISSTSKQIFIRDIIRGCVRPQVDEAAKSAKPELAPVAPTAQPTTPLGPAASPGKKAAKGPKPSAVLPGAKTGDPSGGAAVMLGDDTNPNQKAKVEAEIYKKTIDSGIQIEVETLGSPYLRPGTVVAVQGLGKKFDGNYSVQKVTHKIGTSGYTTSWTGINTGGYLAASSARAAGANNTAQVQTAAGTVKTPTKGD
jgi:hypothetical protein